MRRGVMAVCGLTVLAAFALTVECASASTRSSGAFGPSIPRGGGTVNFTAFSNNDGPTSVLVLTGDVGDYGHAVRITTSGSKTQDNELRLSMSRGSFRLDIAGIEGKLVKALGSDFPTNAKTCSGLEVVAGTAPIVSGSGTQAYAGLYGTFHLKITINEVEKWPNCPRNDTSPYLAQSVFIDGSGSVSLK